MDGVRMSGATHSADSEVLVTENSNSNPQIKNGRSPLQNTVYASPQTLRRVFTWHGRW